MFRFFIVFFSFVFSFSYGQLGFIEDNASLWLRGDFSGNCKGYNYDCVLKKIDKNYKVYGITFSFFIAFKSNLGKDKDIASLQYGDKRITIGNNYVVKDQDTIAILDKDKLGKIVSYTHSDYSYSRQGKLFLEDLSSLGNDYGILEVIYIPEVVSRLVKERIETYLSLKYGFSLASNEIYRGVKNDTIWNADRLLSFSNDVTGMGCDLANFYREDTSYNYNLKGFELSTSVVFSDNDYVLWGHNGKEVVLAYPSDLKDDNFRIWHFNKPLSSFSSERFHLKFKKIYLDKEVDSLDKEQQFYLYVSDYNPDNTINFLNGDYYEGKITDSGDLVFKDVVLRHNSRFVFIRSSTISFTAKALSDCENSGKLLLYFKSVDLPVDVTVKGDDFLRRYTVKDTSFIIEGLASGFYNLEVKNTLEGFTKQSIEIKEDRFPIISLRDTWALNSNGFVDVAPDVFSTSTGAKYSWIFNNKLIGSSESIRVFSAGDYVLEAKNELCEKHYNFKVISGLATDISLYPNPVSVNDNVFITIPNFKQNTLSVRINDLSGRLIHTYKINQLDNNLFQFSFKQKGVFVVNIKTDKSEKNYKVIVN